MDASGGLYFPQFYNHQVRKISPDGTITTIAGNGVEGLSGDGAAATSAQVALPSSVAVDAAGNVYVADFVGNSVAHPYSQGVIRLLEPDGPAPAIISLNNAASKLPGAIAPGETVFCIIPGLAQRS